MATIAIVTSTSFGSDNEACFKSGLSFLVGGKSSTNNPPPFQSPNGSYDLATLQNLIRSAVNNNPRPDLIVTAGGLPTAMAAAAELTHPNDPKFIFLTGDALGGNPTALAGGVNMNNPGEDTARKKLLTDPPIQWRPANYTWLSILTSTHLQCPTRMPTIGPQPRSPNSSMVFPIPLTPPPPSMLSLRISKTVSQPPRVWLSAQTRIFVFGGRLSPQHSVVYSLFRYAILFKILLTQSIINLTSPIFGNSVPLDQPKLNDPNDSSDACTAYFQLGKQTGRFLAGTANVKVVKWDAANSTWSQPS